MNCKEIYELICAHTDRVSIFICARNWANENNGVLVAKNLDKGVFLTRFGNKIPSDWALCCNADDDWIDLGFLF